MSPKEGTSNIFFRMSLFVAVLSLVILVLLSLTALQRAGDLKVGVQIFSTTKDSSILRDSSQLNTILPIMPDEARKKGKSVKIIDEMLARYYLMMRYEQVPDTSEMAYRWGRNGPVYLLSTPKVYRDFVGDFKKKISNLKNTVNSIEITQLTRNADNSFSIDFVIYESLPNEDVPFATPKHVDLKFRYFKAREIMAPKFNNPYGFVIGYFEETKSDIKSAQN